MKKTTRFSILFLIILIIGIMGFVGCGSKDNNDDNDGICSSCSKDSDCKEGLTCECFNRSGLVCDKHLCAAEDTETCTL